MFPLYVAVFAAAVSVSHFAFVQPDIEVEIKQTRSETRAARLFITRHAAGLFYTANPLTVGVIPNASLIPFLPLGGAIDPSVVARVDGNQLYTYTLTSALAGDITALAKLSNCSELSGMAIAGNTYRASCITVGAGLPILPVFVPAGSLVTIGK